MSISDKIMGILGLVVLLTFGAMVQETLLPLPDFKVGDCIRYEFAKEEFKPKKLSRIMHEVVQVGNRNYLTLQHWAKNNNTVESTEQDFGQVTFFRDHHVYVKVNCKTGGVL